MDYKCMEHIFINKFLSNRLFAFCTSITFYKCYSSVPVKLKLYFFDACIAEK